MSDDGEKSNYTVTSVGRKIHNIWISGQRRICYISQHSWRGNKGRRLFTLVYIFGRNWRVGYNS